jgi:hypothetical protein
MNPAKIRLSQKEIELITNADWILTKNAILQKVNALLGNIQQQQKEILHRHQQLLPKELLSTTPKISKGENYNGLPYQVLDFPRIFNRKDVFTIRTLFWWGNFFSITLHLSGQYKKAFEKKIVSALPSFASQHFFICISDDEWQHHFEETNYQPIATLSSIETEQLIVENPFIKLAQKIPLQEWDHVENIVAVSFDRLIQAVCN